MLESSPGVLHDALVAGPCTARELQRDHASSPFPNPRAQTQLRMLRVAAWSAHVRPVPSPDLSEEAMLESLRLPRAEGVETSKIQDMVGKSLA